VIVFALHPTAIRGTELAGAMKNVMAVAAGICDGLRLGTNARPPCSHGVWPRWGRSAGAMVRCPRHPLTDWPGWAISCHSQQLLAATTARSALMAQGVSAARGQGDPPGPWRGDDCQGRPCAARQHDLSPADPVTVVAFVEGLFHGRSGAQNPDERESSAQEKR